MLPKRWIVERTFAWISRNRRLARDFERYTTTVAAFIRLAMIRIMLRRLAANPSASIQTSRMGSIDLVDSDDSQIGRRSSELLLR